MANYFGAALRLKLKLDAPSFVKKFMDDWIVKQDLSRYSDMEMSPGMGGAPTVNGDANTLIKLTGTARPDMAAYGWFLVEEQDDGVVYSTTSSEKYFDEGVIALTLSVLLPYLVVKDGDVLYRQVYDDYIDEEVLFVHEGKIRANYGLAYFDSEYTKDDRHPYNFDWKETPVNGINDWEQFSQIPRDDRYMYVVGLFTPPWTMAEINAQNEETLAKRQVAPYRPPRVDRKEWEILGKIWLSK